MKRKIAFLAIQAIFYFICICFFCHPTLSAQENWERTYSCPNYFATQSQILEVEGSLLLFSIKDNQILAKKIEPNTGNIIWAKKFICPYPIKHYRVQQSSNDKSIVVAAEVFENNVSSSLILLKINYLSGGYNWFRNITLQTFSYLGKNGLFVNSAGEIFLTGVTANTNEENNFNSFLLKFNPSGQTVFHRIYPINPTDYDFAHNILELPDKSLTIVGALMGFQKDGFILFTDANGQNPILKVYDPSLSYNDYLEKIQFVNNNLCLSGILDNNPFLVMVDREGNPINNPVSPLLFLTPSNFINPHFSIENHDIWFAASTSNDFFLSKIQANGNLELALQIGGTLADTLFSSYLSTTFIYLAGNTKNFNAVGTDNYLIKLNKQNLLSCNQRRGNLTINNFPYERPVQLPITPTTLPTIRNTPLLIDADNEQISINYPCCPPYRLQIDLLNNCFGITPSQFRIRNPKPHTQYIWDVENDGWLEQKSTQTEFHYRFPAPGFYEIKVVAYDTLSGCKDSITENYYIAGAKVIISTPSVLQICDNEPGIRLQVSETLVQGNPCSYRWLP
ncbi:MAG: hypothetical protein RML72_06815, partial [Bacteroidia bacterium]|nr:hypothetical protein [Bacteroidia bacterium]MDW8158571.1 hypothetical protein [Bacteroidia bacterium]